MGGLDRNTSPPSPQEELWQDERPRRLDGSEEPYVQQSVQPPPPDPSNTPHTSGVNMTAPGQVGSDASPPQPPPPPPPPPASQTSWHLDQGAVDEERARDDDHTQNRLPATPSAFASPGDHYNPPLAAEGHGSHLEGTAGTTGASRDRPADSTFSSGGNDGESERHGADEPADDVRKEGVLVMKKHTAGESTGGLDPKDIEAFYAAQKEYGHGGGDGAGCECADGAHFGSSWADLVKRLRSRTFVKRDTVGYTPVRHREGEGANEFCQRASSRSCHDTFEREQEEKSRGACCSDLLCLQKGARHPIQTSSPMLSPAAARFLCVH